MSITMEQKNNIYGEIINNLKVELDSLTVIIKKTREERNFGNYKNMILAYKEVLKIYMELIDDIDKNKELSFKFNFPNANSSGEIEKALKNLSNYALQVMGS